MTDSGITTPDDRGPRSDGESVFRFQNHLFAWLVVFSFGLSLRVVSYHDMKKCPLFTEIVVLADSRYYDQKACDIVDVSLWGDEVFFMAPMYEYLLAGVYTLHGLCFPHAASQPGATPTRFDFVIYMQCVLGALTCCLLYGLGRRLFGVIGGWTAGLLACLYGPFIFFDGLLMPTTLILFLNNTMLVMLVRAAQKDSPFHWGIGGASVGLGAVAHGTSLLMAPATFLAVLAQARKRSATKTWVKLFGFTIGVLFPILPVTIRNYIVGQDLVLLTSNAGMNLFIGNNATATGTHVIYRYPYRLASIGDYMQGVKRLPDDPLPSEVSRSIGNEAWSWMKAHPRDALRLLARKFAMFFNVVEIGRNDNYQFFQQFSRVLSWPVAAFGIVAPLGLTGAVCLFSRRRDLQFIYLLLGTQVAGVVIMFVLGRYRFPAVACLVLLAAGWVSWTIEKIRKRHYFAVVGSAGLLGMLALGVHQGIEGIDREYGAGKNYVRLGEELEEMGLKDQAVRAYAQGLNLPWPDGMEMVWRYRGLGRLGELYKEAGNMEQAITSWEKARWEIGNEIREEMGRESNDRIEPARLSLDALRHLESQMIARLAAAYADRKSRVREK